mgnify:CR=1 FL=1
MKMYVQEWKLQRIQTFLDTDWWLLNSFEELEIHKRNFVYQKSKRKKNRKTFENTTIKQTLFLLILLRMYM